MTIYKMGICFLLVPLSCWSCKAEREGAPITPEEIEAHIRFLSDDLLEGRAVGSRGLAIAALYHENYFRSLGLEPAFGQSFRQSFTLLGSQADLEASLEIFLDNKTIRCEFAKDFLVGSSREDTPEGVEGAPGDRGEVHRTGVEGLPVDAGHGPAASVVVGLGRRLP